MRILLVASAFNSLTQRVQAELQDRGHQAAFVLAAGGAEVRDAALRDAVRAHRPELLVAPMLTTAIPDDVWRAVPTLIVHPGPVGDRGPSSLDRAVQEGARRWGVTVLQATAEMDGGDVWATAGCDLPAAGKSDLYRGEVADAALDAVLLAVVRFGSGTYRPLPQPADAVVTRPYLRQEQRRIDWSADGTAAVLRRLRAADSRPGVLDRLLGEDWYLHGGHPEGALTGPPGELLATRAGAVCRATADGAVWIPELRAPRARGGRTAGVKLPAAVALGDRVAGLPELPAAPDGPEREWKDICYREEGRAGFLEFSFPGGAMSTAHCARLLAAYRQACTRPTSVLVLGGGRDFFGNGIHLNVIEAAADPAAESWANLTAMDDLVEAVLTTTDKLVVAALGGNAAAGGVMLALAADEVWCRTGVVLNPHYRLMGLYGSEFWTYSLPRRVGAAAARRLTERAQPVSAAAALRTGLVDQVVAAAPQDFRSVVARQAGRLASGGGTQGRIARKKEARERDEAVRPLAAYREAELAVMRRIFDDPAAPYHALRAAFVRKQPRPPLPDAAAPGMAQPDVTTGGGRRNSDV
ncbi:hydrogenase maturation protein [Streptomyces sp. NPDC021020]|uniref:hydrogenase maturation protein n=1 Tax=Streptomyces sp. NPDC021020 TaxID=3365109 RepID=UPI0037A768CD